MAELSEIIASHSGKGFLIAPAGFGKTHLIASAIQSVETGKELILTHTYAGVNAIKNKLRKLGVKSQKFRVDTIASWALGLCSAYPQRSGWVVQHPEGQQWGELYASASRFLDKGFVKRIIKASYSGVYIDEYQDCTSGQHELVLKLSDILSCRILGDPLQGIFNIGGEEIVDWDTQIFPNFEHLGDLDTPWRWKDIGDESLGTWLAGVRQKMESNQPIDLLNGIPSSVTVHITSSDDEKRNIQINTCKYFSCANGNSVIAIHKGDSRHKAQCHLLAKNTTGRFSSIEEIEGKRLFQFVKEFDRKNSAQQRLLLAIKFAKNKCMSGVTPALSAGTGRGEVVLIGRKTKNPALVAAANEYLSDDCPLKLKRFFLALKESDGVALYARDLFNRLLKTLEMCSQLPEQGVEHAARQYHLEFRHSGRPLRYSRLVGTTLLVKGLEFDHAIVLDAASLSKKDLYVALTRGSKSLTIISSEPILNPS